MKNYLLHTETVIDSCHYLKGYDGKCSELHGHTWLLKVWIKGSKLDDVGILFDFTKIKTIKNIFDHKLINKIKPFDEINPTAENMSRVIYEWLKINHSHLEFCVRLYETAVGKETWCEYGDFNV